MERRRPTRRLALLLLAAAGWTVLTPLPGATAADAVDLPSDWRIGETVRLVMTRSQFQERGLERQIFGRSRTRISLEVMDKHPGGYVFGWTIEDVALLDRPPESDQVTARIGDLVNGVRLELETAPSGSVLSLRNLGEAQSLFSAAELGLLDSLRANGLTQFQSDRISAQLSRTFDSRFIEQSFLKQPEQFMFPSGRRYSLDQPVAYRDYLPNPFGGAPVPSRGILELLDVDAARDAAHIEWRQTIDLERSRDQLIAALWQVDSRLNMSSPDQIDRLLEQVSVTDSGTYEYDLTSGWPRSAVFVQTTVVDDFRQVQRTEINRVSSF